MTCDDLPLDGRDRESALRTRFAALARPDLADYFARVAFPSTMIDRIVPATTDADRAIVTELTGLDDAWPIMTKPFTQWVIEDNFPAGRPPSRRSAPSLSPMSNPMS